MQCTTIVSNPKIKNYLTKDFVMQYVNKLNGLHETLAQQQCLKSCKRMENNVQFLQSVHKTGKRYLTLFIVNK